MLIKCSEQEISPSSTFGTRSERVLLLLSRLQRNSRGVQRDLGVSKILDTVLFEFDCNFPWWSTYWIWCEVVFWSMPTHKKPLCYWDWCSEFSQQALLEICQPVCNMMFLLGEHLDQKHLMALWFIVFMLSVQQPPVGIRTTEAGRISVFPSLLSSVWSVCPSCASAHSALWLRLNHRTQEVQSLDTVITTT